MKIVCPNCQSETEIEFSEHIKCECCENSAKENERRRKAISKSLSLSPIILACYLTYKVENLIEPVRYPVKLEYSIISECANGYQNGYLSSSSRKHIDTCICALEKTMNDVKPKNENKEFTSEFQKNLYECSR